MDRRQFTRATMAMLTLAVANLGPAFAQQMPSQPTPGTTLEELAGVEVASVYTAARHEQRLGDAPASVTIITAQDITLFGWRTLADVLNSVRGFYVTNDRNYSYIGVNGFGRPTDYNNRVLILVDGHRANDNIYDGALVGTEFPIDLALIARVEIIRGPGSALYGTSAFFAVVNLVTKGGGALGAFESGFEVASEQLYRVRASYGAAPTSTRQWLISASRYSSEGASSLYFPEYDDDANAFGVTRHTDADEATSIFGSAQFGALSVQGVFGARGKLVPTGSWGATFGDPRNRTRDTRGWLTVKHQVRLQATELVARAAIDHVGYEGFYVYAPDAYVDKARGNWVSGELGTDTQVNARVRLGAGLEARRHFDQDQWGFYLSDANAFEPDSFVESTQVAYYGQGELAIVPRATVTLGARYDRWSFGPNAWKPRAGLVIHPVPDGSIKLLHGGAFRSPTVYEMNYFERQPLYPPLQPEEVTTTEVVYEQSLRGRMRLTGSVFRTRINALITEQGEANDVYFTNSDDAISSGAAADVEVRWPTGLLLRAGYSYQRVRDAVTDAPLSNAPRHIATGSLAIPMFERRLTTALDVTHVGSRLTTALSETDAATVAHVNVLFRPRGSRVSFAGSVYNVFDTAYAHPVGAEFLQTAIRQAGRTASLRAVVQF